MDQAQPEFHENGVLRHGLVCYGKVHHYRWYDSLHYRNRINNMQVEDTEFAFPLREAPNTNPYNVVSEAFKRIKDSIDAHAVHGRYPVDITFEMRFTGGSTATLSHYPLSVSNKWVHMEYLCFSVSGKKNEKLAERWHRFIQEVSNKWQPLGGNPHWAKGWQTIDNIFNTLRNAEYTTKFRQFRETVDPAGKFLSDQLARLFAK